MTEARRFLDSGDRTHALEEVDAVLAIDPGFVAAHSLRHHILVARYRQRHDTGAPASRRPTPPHRLRSRL